MRAACTVCRKPLPSGHCKVTCGADICRRAYIRKYQRVRYRAKKARAPLQVIASGAFDGCLPAEVPVRLGRGGPVVGIAVVTGDELGLVAEFTTSRPGVHAVDFGELRSMSFRIPDDGS